MKIKIFDVSHGFCAYIVADNGNVMLIDCGHNEETGFRPSSYLVHDGCTGIAYLVIQNFDQDHISDLPNILQLLPVSVFYRNRSVSPAILTDIKKSAGPLTPQMKTVIGLHDRYIYDVASPPVLQNIEFRSFCNSYPLFTDTNNLSLVTFVHCDGMGIVFTGDLETAGWRTLLQDTAFREHLKRVKIFVASHHGRLTGYCEDVFNYCHPEIIILSDKEIIHKSQEQDYAKHASGVSWNNGTETRCVLTTRSDGMIIISKDIDKGFYIQTSN